MGWLTIREASHGGAGGEVYRRSLWVHSHMSRDRLRDTVGQQAPKSGQMAEREAGQSELKLNPAGIFDHRTFREEGCCFFILPPKSCTRFSFGQF